MLIGRPYVVHIPEVLYLCRMICDRIMGFHDSMGLLMTNLDNSGLGCPLLFEIIVFIHFIPIILLLLLIILVFIQFSLCYAVNKLS